MKPDNKKKIKLHLQRFKTGNPNSKPEAIIVQKRATNEKKFEIIYIFRTCVF